jgi:predicted transposase YbfD/YdcC
VERLLTILREVRDPRDLNARHDCAMLLFTALLATLCGAKSAVAIADFTAANAADLAEVVDLPNGPPSHDSYSRLFRLLDPQELSTALTAFARALRDGLGLGPAKGVVSIDGKRLRRGYERGKSHMPPVMVSVWDAQTRLSLAARAAPDGNEVKASLAALRSLDLKGCVVTADALHCHPKMAQTIRKSGAHYALKLKGNYAPLYERAIAEFAKADAKGKVPCHETRNEKPSHDRFEHRRAWLIPAPKDIDFPDLAMLGRITCERSCVKDKTSSNGKTSSNTYYVALSRKMTPARMLETVVTYWSVENQLHWPLDVVFHEDDARTRKDHAPYNFSVIRRLALDILKAHPDERSVSRKMNLAAWKKEFLFELFAHLR